MGLVAVNSAVAEPIGRPVPAVRTERDQAVEALRIVSAFGVVWFHAAAPASTIGYAGLIVFVLLSVYFEVGPNRDRPVNALHLAKRLLIPWAVWWCGYAALNVALGDPLIDTTHGVWAGVLSGPSVHLWYLPFMFVALLASGSAKRALSVTTLCVLASVLALALILGVSLWRGPSLAAGYPVAQWAHALAPVMIGAVVGLMPGSRLRYACLATVLVAAAVSSFSAYGSVGLIYLLGALLTLGALYAPQKIKAAMPELGWLSGAMLGVYLLHPFVLRVVRPLTEVSSPVGVIVAFLLSALAILAAQRVAPRVSRWVA